MTIIQDIISHLNATNDIPMIYDHSDKKKRVWKRNLVGIIIIWMSIFLISNVKTVNHDDASSMKLTNNGHDWINQQRLWSATCSWWWLLTCITLSWWMWEECIWIHNDKNNSNNYNNNCDDHVVIRQLLYQIMDQNILATHENNDDRSINNNNFCDRGNEEETRVNWTTTKEEDETVRSRSQDGRLYEKFWNDTINGWLGWSICWFWYEFILLLSSSNSYPIDSSTTNPINASIFISWIPPLISLGLVLHNAFPLRSMYIKFIQFPFGPSPVTFLDGFIADICTSMIWPIVSLVMSLYGLFLTTIYFTAPSIAASNDTQFHLILHAYLLPIVRITPLWWRFTQCLRSCFDSKQRWPHLGNALKYMMTAHISLYGIHRHSSTNTTGTDIVWYFTWILTTSYQLYWDIRMDWNLLSFNCNNYNTSMRSRRLYTNKTIYIFICTINSILRFGWTWSYLPSIVEIPKSLQGITATEISKKYKVADWLFFSWPHLSFTTASLLAFIEIARRMLWGWIRVEWEIIVHLQRQQKDGMTTSFLSLLKDDDNDDSNLQPMRMELSTNNMNMNDQDDILIVMELGLWATAFTTLSIFAAIH